MVNTSLSWCAIRRCPCWLLKCSSTCCRWVAVLYFDGNLQSWTDYSNTLHCQASYYLYSSRTTCWTEEKKYAVFQPKSPSRFCSPNVGAGWWILSDYLLIWEAFKSLPMSAWASSTLFLLPVFYVLLPHSDVISPHLLEMSLKSTCLRTVASKTFQFMDTWHEVVASTWAAWVFYLYHLSARVVSVASLLAFIHFLHVLKTLKLTVCKGKAAENRLSSNNSEQALRGFSHQLWILGI